MESRSGHAVHLHPAAMTLAAAPLFAPRPEPLVCPGRWRARSSWPASRRRASFPPPGNPLGVLAERLRFRLRICRHRPALYAWRGPPELIVREGTDQSGHWGGPPTVAQDVGTERMSSV